MTAHPMCILHHAILYFFELIAIYHPFSRVSDAKPDHRSVRLLDSRTIIFSCADILNNSILVPSKLPVYRETLSIFMRDLSDLSILGFDD